MTNRVPGTWDRGLDYLPTYTKLVRIMKNENPPKRCYAAILLIQLRNGSRVSEAARAFFEFAVDSRKNEVRVRVSKKKAVEYRLMVRPEDWMPEIDRDCKSLVLLPEKRLIARVKMFAQSIDINTHSLRYAYITHLLKNGVDPATVSTIIKHANLNTILSYVQRKHAEDTLRNMG